MFKVGELVTGKDRSYTRSIYKLVRSLDEVEGLYRPVAFNGAAIYLGSSWAANTVRYHSEFRIAEPDELKKAGYNATVPLVDLLVKLKMKFSTSGPRFKPW